MARPEKSSDPVLEELRRSSSLSSATSFRTAMSSVSDYDSTLSLEALGAADIDALVNRKWRLEEIVILLQSRMAILSGGRDRRGAPIITIFGTEHSNFRPTNVAKLLSYLSKVSDESLQGLGFTLILDMSQASWLVTKKSLKALQLTFVEHIHQVLVVKPKAFWQKRKVGMNFTLKKSKYNFPITMLDNSTELFLYLQASQVTKDLGGTLDYDHYAWIEKQKVLEKHLTELQYRLEGMEQLREQLEQLEDPTDLNEARDSVRRHVEAHQQLDKVELDTLCETVSHSISKLQPCSNPDFKACFSRMEDLCGVLQSNRKRLEGMWNQKGDQLDKVLQLRVFEHDSEQLAQWFLHETNSLSHEHTDIGDGQSVAEAKRRAFEEFRGRAMNKYHELSRVANMAERLITARHYASDVMQERIKELKRLWEVLVTMIEERSVLLQLSVDFHSNQKKFFDQVEDWMDDCIAKEFPSTVPRAEELLATHNQLRDTFQNLYFDVRKEGHQIVEKLRKPVGSGSLPTKFVVGTRHVKETLESMYDEKNWLDEQWQRRNAILTQALNLTKYQEESKKVYLWLSETGNPFLSSSNTIGSSAVEAQELLKRHDKFEADTGTIYALASAMFSKAKTLASKGDCDPERITEEAETLEGVVNSFASSLDERREIILHSQNYHQKMDTLLSDFAQLTLSVSHEKFNGSSSDVEPRLEEFQSHRARVKKSSEESFKCCHDLIARLKAASKSAQSAKVVIDYSVAIEMIRQRLERGRDEERKAWEVCERRENRWKLTIRLNQLDPDVEKHLTELLSWTQEKELTEWEPAENTMDAQLQLDAFQRQYDLLKSSNEELVARGRSSIEEINQSDLVMFGSTATIYTLPASAKVDKLAVKLKDAKTKMEAMSGPKIEQLQDCLQYHLLQQRANKLTVALSTLSSTLSRNNGVGHTPEAAQALKHQVTESNIQLQAVLQDVDSFCMEVDECIGKSHYAATTLSMLARGLQERKGLVSRVAMEKLKIISASVEFHQNVKELSSSMGKFQAQYSSRETGKTVSDINRLLKSLEETKTFIDQAAEVVKSQGRKVLDIVLQTASKNRTYSGGELGSSPYQSPMNVRRNFSADSNISVNKVSPLMSDKRRRIQSVEDTMSRTTPPTERRRARHISEEISTKGSSPLVERSASHDDTRTRSNSFDILKMNDDVIPEDSESTISRSDSGPKLLAKPRKTGMKAASSVPLFMPATEDQQVISGMMENVDNQLNELLILWMSRKNRLEQSRKAVEFREAVPEVLSWVEEKRKQYLIVRHGYGRSIEEVKHLIEENQKFLISEMSPVAERAHKLMELYKTLEEGGAYNGRNELRALSTTLEKQWRGFEEAMKKYVTNLDLSLKFQETLFEASNWCQTSQQFLNSMEEKVDMCDRSEEAASLTAELTLYISVTKEQQTGRVEQLKNLSEFLHSNLLSELAAQISQTTQRTVLEYKTTRNNLEKLHSKLVQIEGEKDREMRLVKQRERVLEELLQTEEAFVSDLRLIVEKCRPRFVSDLLPNSLKGKESIIFGNIHEIEKFHRSCLLPKLKECAGDIETTSRVFTEYGEEMKMVYVPFCKGKADSEELLASHRSYLNRFQSMFGTDTPLSSLLIKPVQRITKYPLLLKEALKYSTELGQSLAALEDAVHAVESIPIATNNAIHLSLLENSTELTKELGQLLYQSSLTVSEPKFGSSKKERHVFAFSRALLFARKVELGQKAKFKYEYKSQIALSKSVQVVEFVEGDSCKFALVSGDQRLHFKSSSLDIKQQWIKGLRSAILEKNTNKLTNVNGKMENGSTQHGTLAVESWPKDLGVPSPLPSPTPTRKTNGKGSTSTSNGVEYDVGGFEKYQVVENYKPPPADASFSLTLTKGDIVEVMDNSIVDKWYVRILGGSMDHGWIPSSVLKQAPVNGVDSVDAGTLGIRKKSKGGWVHITSGPMSAGSDDDKLKELKLKNQTSFGSHDLQSHHVISTLKRVTFDKEQQVVPEEGDEEESSSLDKPVSKRDRSHTLPAIPSDFSNLDVPLTPLSVHSPSSSPASSPRNSPRNSNRRHFTEASTGGHARVLRQRSSGSERDKTPSSPQNWTKTEWRRRVIRKRSGRNQSVSSDHSDHSDNFEGQSMLEHTGVHSPEVPQSPTLKVELHSSSSNESLTKRQDSRASSEVPEEDLVKLQKAQQKIKFILRELYDTERDYVTSMEQCVNGYMKEMQSPNLPDALKGKEKTIFANMQSVYDFHNNTFFGLIEEAKESLEDVAKCFLDQAHCFEMYVTYCENKPKSESFLWTYLHTGGTFFEEVQNQLGHRQGIDSYLIKPVQRITKYQLLLRDLHKTAQKIGQPTPNLEKALQLMQDVPKRANDAMTLSMIYGYDGNVHASGQLILQDEFTVYERSRWTGAKRNLFLLDQRIIITKEKDADGLFVYKDSLKVRSLSVAEKEGDNPCRFAVGTGPIGSWDQYYVLEASSTEKKQQWVDAIKDILKGQFELLKALKTTTQRPRSNTFDVTSVNSPTQSVAMINLSDDSEQEDDEFEPIPRELKGAPSSSSSTPAAGTGSFHPAWNFNTMPNIKNRAASVSVGEPTPHSPTLRTRSFNLYQVAEDCAPPKEDEGILYIHKGQIYDVIDSGSDWWLARLVRDVVHGSDKFCQQGWIPGSFMDKYGGTLTPEEESSIETALRRKKLLKQSTYTKSSTIEKSSSPHSGRRKSAPNKAFHKLEKPPLVYTSSYTYQEEEEERERQEDDRSVKVHMPPHITSPLSNETVIIGRSVQFKCSINLDTYPPPSVQWTHNDQPLNIDRAFTNFGEETCVLRINDVEQVDNGTYSCTISNGMGVVNSSAKLTVLSPPDPPAKLLVRPLTSTSVSLSWTPPTFTGHSPITIYLVECKDVVSDRWSTLMKRITEPSTVVDDLMPGTEYTFRVIAGNHIGSSDPSSESVPVKMARSLLETEFSLDPFENHYEILEEIGRGAYGTVYECLHSTTQQVYAAKLLPLEVGRDHAQHELEMLSRLAHPNIVQMTSAYLTQQYFIILFQLVHGVNFLEYFTYNDHLTEPCVAGCVEQILSALSYLHSSNIAHLDIKPENIMAVTMEDFTVPDIKLIHFERSREVNPDSNLIIQKLEEHIEYEAPEILAGQPVTLATDMWSLGAVVYTLLGGVSPFLVDSLDLTKDNIVNSRYSFPIKIFRDVSDGAKEFIAKLLTDKSKRPTSDEALKHSWLAVSKLPISDSLVKLNTTRLKSYVSSRKWQSSMFLNPPGFSRL